MKQMRFVVEQFTNAELRQKLRRNHGFGLLTPSQIRRWKAMAYGVLLDRRKTGRDRMPDRELTALHEGR